MDKDGKLIGWMWIDGNNMYVDMVEEGMEKVKFNDES